MGLYTRKYNPVPNTSLVPLAVMWHVKDNVSTYNNLPITGNGEGDLRVTTDTDILYVWSISSSSGLLTDWKAVGTISSIDWSNITNKPSSSVSDIDDAVSKKHAHTNLSILNNIQEALTTTLKNSYDAYAEDIKNNSLNIMLNAFRIAQIGSLTIFNMVKGIMDEYEDESGVDLLACENQEYNSVNDYYTVPVSYDSYTKLMLHLDDDYVDVATAKTITDSGASFTSGIFDSGITFTPSGTAYIYSGASSDFNFGSGDWTVEFWFRMSNTNSKFKLALGSSSFWQIEYGETGTGFTFQPGLGYGYAIGHSFSEITSWHHLALVRNGDVHTLYIDGTAVGSPWTNSDASTANGTTGGTNSGGGFELMNYAGTAVKFDEVRISKGIARWSSDFTPPASPYAPNTTPPNLTLVSKATVATSVPSSARVVLFEEDIDSITINTDLKAFISRDDGTTWTEALLEDEGNYITGARILSAVVDLSTQPSGSDMRYKITTANNKNLKIHGTSVSWK